MYRCIKVNYALSSLNVLIFFNNLRYQILVGDTNLLQIVEVHYGSLIFMGKNKANQMIN